MGFSSVVTYYQARWSILIILIVYITKEQTFPDYTRMRQQQSHEIPASCNAP